MTFASFFTIMLRQMFCGGVAACAALGMSAAEDTRGRLSC